MHRYTHDDYDIVSQAGLARDAPEIVQEYILCWNRFSFVFIQVDQVAILIVHEKM
jgi:hypothetical protein